MQTIRTQISAEMALSKNVRDLRSSAGLSQKELAHAIGVSHPRVSDIERQVGNPTLSTINKLAEFFEISVADLLSSENHQKTA